MNSNLNEINEIIGLCDSMVEVIMQGGMIWTGNTIYETYKKRINAFFTNHNELQRNYGPYLALGSLFFKGSSYSVSLSEARIIRDTVISMKHELYPECFEKIFISHREKDKEQVAAFVDLLHAIGIPRPTAADPDTCIFCTSHPEAYIANGEKNLEEIRRQFNSSAHTFFILWYTDHYFESQACLNEAGAIWAMNKRYQEILLPSFKSEKIGGLLDKQPVWFKADNKFRLNTFKEQLEKMFSLSPLMMNAWELARDAFISRILALDGGSVHANT